MRDELIQAVKKTLADNPHEIRFIVICRDNSCGYAGDGCIPSLVVGQLSKTIHEVQSGETAAHPDWMDEYLEHALPIDEQNVPEGH